MLFQPRDVKSSFYSGLKNLIAGRTAKKLCRREEWSHIRPYVLSIGSHGARSPPSYFTTTTGMGEI